MTLPDAEEWLNAHPEAWPAYDWVCGVLTGVPYAVRATKSQLSFRRRRGFAYLWLPRMYVRTDVEVVLSLAVGRRLDSARFKEVVHPSARVWMHHLELASTEDLDDEVAAWLLEAADHAV